MVRIATIALAALLLLGPASLVQAADDGQHAKAQALVQTGLKEARAKRFEAAARNFDAALKLYPHPEIAHNLARAHEELGHTIEALNAFKKALEMDAGYTYAEEARKRITALDTTLRKTHGVLTVRSTPESAALTILVDQSPFEGHLTAPVTRYVPAGAFVIRGAKAGFISGEQSGEIAAGQEAVVELVLRPVPKKGFLSVTSDVKGAEVSIDGEVVGTAPLEGYALAAGQHAVRVSAEGRTPFETSVRVEPNIEQRVSAMLPPMSAVSGPLAATSSASDLGLWGGVLLGAGGGIAVIATTLWVFTFEKASDAQNALYDAEWEEARDSAMALQSGAIVASITAGLALAGGTALLLWPDDDVEDADAASWIPVVTPTKGGFGVGAALRF